MTANASKQDERHIVCVVQARPEHRARVEALLLELVGPARAEPGCLYYDLYRQADQHGTFTILDGWASQAAVAAHAAHPNVPRVTDQLLPLLAAPLSVTVSHRLTDPT